jgi:hypothetical protein
MTLPEALVGFRVRATTPADLDYGLKHGIRLAAVVAHHGGDTWLASVSELRPDNDAERSDILDAVDRVQPVLLGTSPRLPLGPRLSTFLRDPQNPKSVVTSTVRGWSFTSGTVRVELRAQDTRWVVMERHPFGVAVSVMTSALDFSPSP